MEIYFKNTKKNITMTEEDGKDCRNNTVCRFCEKNFESDKIRDHCHLTNKNRGPDHSECNENFRQKQSNFQPVVFHICSNYDCYMFFKKLVDKKNVKVKIDIILKTNGEYFSVIYGCIRFNDSYRFLTSSLDSLGKTLVDNSNKTFKNLREEIVNYDEILNIVNEIVEKKTKLLKI